MKIKNLNSARDDIKRLRDKVSNDLRSLMGLCMSMQKEIERRYHEEVSLAGGETDGLEEFNTVARGLKMDQRAVSGALAIIRNQVRGASGYDFEEIAVDSHVDLDGKKDIENGR